MARLGRGLRLVLVLRDARRKELDLDLRLRESVRLQRLRHRLHHAVRTADEGGVDVGQIDPVRKQRIGFLLIDTAVEKSDVLRLPAHDVDQVEAIEVTVLEIG